jgi:hypothetical protein
MNRNWSSTPADSPVIWLVFGRSESGTGPDALGTTFDLSRCLDVQKNNDPAEPTGFHHMAVDRQQAADGAKPTTPPGLSSRRCRADRSRNEVKVGMCPSSCHVYMCKHDVCVAFQGNLVTVTHTCGCAIVAVPKSILECSGRQTIYFETRHASKQRLHVLAQPKQSAGYTARAKQAMKVCMRLGVEH